VLTAGIGLFLHELLHPGSLARHGGYWFFSGIFGGSAFLSGAAGMIAVYWHHHNCHVQRCWRLSWHPHTEHGHPVCRRHHPHGGRDLAMLQEKNHRY
jgi:hypothetical protein